MIIINSYERIKARVSANKLSEEEFYLLGFLGGLKEEIADAIILHNPTTLKSAYKLARQIEKSLDSQQKLFKPLTRTMNSAQPYSQTRIYKPKDDNYSSKPTDTMAPKPLSIEQKKTLGLCFRCGERYFVGHKCQNKGLHVLEDEELLCTKELSLEETSHELHDHTLDNTQGLITMCASQLQSKHKTLKFQGQIGQLAVLAMIDSGSTHSFINPTIVQILDLPTTSATPLTVITASGVKLTSSLLCSQLQFTL
jgi:Aspartyl protease